MEQDQWEHLYSASKENATPAPAKLLCDNRHILSGGSALDIAMGAGQNAVCLASLGYAVTGFDVSPAAVSRAKKHALEKGVGISAVAEDAGAFIMAETAYDVILNFYFLDRNLFPRIRNGLKRNGLIFFETYTIEQKRFGRPRNPDFLLKPNELLNEFLDFFILFYHERIETSRAVASLIARKL